MIMVDYCCAPGCCNKRGEKKGRAFYRLPKEEPRRSQWIAVINRAMNKKEKWDPSHGGVYRLCSEHFISVVKKQGDECQKLSGERRRLWLAKLNQDLRGKNLDNIRICSAHFLSGKKSDLYQKDNPDWVPSVGMTGQQRGRKSNNPFSPDYIPSIFKVVPPRVRKRKEAQLKNLTRRQDGKRQRRKRKSLAAEGLFERSPPRQPVASSASCSMFADDPKMAERSSLDVPERTDTNGLKNTPCHKELCQAYMKSMGSKCHALRIENTLLKDRIDNTSFDERGLENDDEKVNMLTGIPTYTLLITTFDMIGGFLKGKSDLSPFQQYLMTLMKVRLNCSFEFLAFFFCVGIKTAFDNFKHCINVLYCKVVPSFVFWPDRDWIETSLPRAFRNDHFCKTVCIIDYFEILMEMPKDPLASAQCRSSKKSHCTQKYLVGMSPQGSISFISNGWGGKISDKHVTKQSGFLSKLLPDDLVLAGSGCDAADSANSCQAGLKIAAFTRGKKQLDPLDLGKIRGLASVEKHVEKVTRALREKYKMLQSTVPISLIDIECMNDVTYLDKIVKVCCALTNISEFDVPSQ
ncbi:uncharacterized protein LOC144022809 isoform X2 [Festucalex cinctus]